MLWNFIIGTAIVGGVPALIKLAEYVRMAVGVVAIIIIVLTCVTLSDITYTIGCWTNYSATVCQNDTGLWPRLYHLLPKN
jgi:hypothetical protein